MCTHVLQLITTLQNKLNSTIDSDVVLLFAVWCLRAVWPPIELQLLCHLHLLLLHGLNLSEGPTGTCDTFEKKQQVHLFLARPLFHVAFICCHLPQETNGPTNSCVTEKQSTYEWVWGRGRPRGLVTICLRRCSCQLLFLSHKVLTLSTCSLQSHDVCCNL